MRGRSGERGLALPVVLILLTVLLVALTYLLTRSSYEMKFSVMNRRSKTASALANNVATALFRQFSQNLQEDHYDPANLNRPAQMFGEGFSSATITPNKLQHSIYFNAVGAYGSDVNNPLNRKTFDGVVKFISDLTTFGTMSNGNFTTGAANVTYLGKVWINGSWSIPANNTAVQGGPVFVNGTLNATGGSLTINGDLYHSGSLTGPITVNGSNYNFVPQMNWPTIDPTYFDQSANVTVTANSTVRFNYQPGSSTGTVKIGTVTYAIPPAPDGFIIYAKNCDITAASGTVHGRVTLVAYRTGASGGSITFDSDLQYATAGSTSNANSGDAFAAIANQPIVWNRSANKDLFISGVYFVDNYTLGQPFQTTCSGCTNRTLHFFGTRNQQIYPSGWTSYAVAFDPNLDTYPPPGLPERAHLVDWRMK